MSLTPPPRTPSSTDTLSQNRDPSVRADREPESVPAQATRRTILPDEHGGGRAPRPPTERPRHPYPYTRLHPIDPTERTPTTAQPNPSSEPTGQAPIPQAGLGQEPARTALPANPPGQKAPYPTPKSPYPTPGPPARTRKTPPPRPARRARPPPPPPRFRTRLVSTPAGRVRKMIPVSVCGASRPEVIAAPSLSRIGATRSIPLWADPADFFVIP